MSITINKEKPSRVYVTATDPVTKRSKSQVFYNTTPEQFIVEAVEKLCHDPAPRRTRTKQSA